MRSNLIVTGALAAIALAPNMGCGGDKEEGTPGQTAASEQILFVAHEGLLTSYDVATGNERAGTVPDVTGPVDIQALADGNVLVNLTGRNEILVVDGKTMLERARIPASSRGALRPVHSYISPELAGKRIWLTLNDGAEDKPESNSALFVDLTPGSPTYLQTVGEVGLGIGHHKAAFSTTLNRVAITNISDCNNVITVFDFSDLANIRSLATLTAEDAGWDGSSFPRTCDPSYRMGVPPAPHGCATSKASKKVYCNLTGSGEIVAVDIDAPTPTFKVLATQGSGGGYSKASRDGRHIFSLQSNPREGAMGKGAVCQIGQLVVVDAESDTMAKEIPLFYKKADCGESIMETPAETNEPGHLQVSQDGKTLLVGVGGGFNVAAARSDQHLLIDISDPKSPVQKPSIAVGLATSHRADALSGDGRFVFTADNVAGTVTQIEVATGQVVKTIATKERPLTVATWGLEAGPSEQTGPIH